ncbi:DUF7683 domain-containing protein [Thermomonospora cellulosilytica]|uniref:DUF7683 domain-containing protein n=1 Tax=Thermomonospora cellulosilytica TaxID=1411118 RepID=UPI00406C20B3
MLEGFDRKSGEFCVQHRLPGLSDEDARSLTGLPDLGDADLYDISETSLAEIAHRFGIKVFPQKFEYLLGRVSSDSP